MSNSEDPKTQVCVCACGAIVGACVEPDCHTDRQWQSTVRKHASKGGKVDMMLASEVRKTTWECKCKNAKKGKADDQH